MKITMLEILNDSHDWEWYYLFEDKTPQEVIQFYLDEIEMEDEIKKIENEGYYEDLHMSEDEGIRAYYVELM